MKAPLAASVLCLAALLLVAPPATHAANLDVISGYWASSLGSGKPGQVFACTTGELGTAVTCTGVGMTKEHPSIVGAGYRTCATEYSIEFSGATGGNYTLVVAGPDEIINYFGKVNKAVPKKDLYIWRRIA